MPEKMPSSFETATTLFGLVGLMAIAASAWLSGSLPMFTLAPGVSVDYVQARTEPRLELASDLHEMTVGPLLPAVPTAS